MDPHSRLSQFNHRTPKSGPQVYSTRFIDPMTLQKSSLDSFSKRPSTSSPSSASLLIRRPIATNSRVKQDEKYRKDMYLSFVNNALQQKANGVSESFDELVGQFNPKRSPGERASQLTQLRLWILALSHVVSRLERTHAALVEAIVNYEWATLDTATVKSYTVFIGMLISARPEYLSLVLGKIAHGFTHQSGIQALDAVLPEGSTAPLTRRVVYDRLHYLLRHLISLIPTLPSTLQPLLVRNFPHKRQNLTSQSTYIRNLLRISVYCPELADKILATIIDRAIQIDVEIQVELEELEEEAIQDQDVFEIDPFDTIVGQGGEESDSDSDFDESDNLSDLSSDAGDMDDVGDAPDVPTNMQHIQDMVKKLDAILTLIFEHFHRTHASLTTPSILQPPLLPDLPLLPSSYPPVSSPIQSPISSPNPYASIEPTISNTPTPPPPPTFERNKALLHSQFHALLSIFDRTILRTFKSRYTQFLIFWYTSLDPEFSDIFQGMLVDRALFQGEINSHNSTPTVTRAAAASYIGSFVSRATFVDREAARRVVGVLCEFLRVHLEGVEALMRMEDGPGVGMQSSVFYAVAQAVFLIFCFRWRDLLEDEDGDEEPLIGSGEKGGKKWMPELGVLQRVVTSVLNPLRVCSTNVVMQFARVAHATDFIYCYTILESNKRSEYGSNNSEGRVNTSAANHHRSGSGVRPTVLGENVIAELNTFFPFDPYRLPRSNSYIQTVYREWASVAIDNDDDEEEEDDEDDEEGKGGQGEGVLNEGYGSFFDIPRSDSIEDKQDEAGGLGESLGAMSISPARPLTMLAVGPS